MIAYLYFNVELHTNIVNYSPWPWTGGTRRHWQVYWNSKYLTKSESLNVKTKLSWTANILNISLSIYDTDNNLINFLW